jgi:hypothetical protein
VVVRQHALAHQAVGDGQAEAVDQFTQFLGRIGQDHAAAGVDQRVLRFGQRADDALGGLVVDRRLVQLLAVVRKALEQLGVDFHREDVHRHRHQHRARTAAFGQLERLFQDLGEQVRTLHAPDALGERAVDLRLLRVAVQVDFLVRVLAVVVAGHVAGDHHQRHRVERRVGHAGGGVGQAGAQVRQDHGRRLAGARVAVGDVRRDLLVARVDELQLAVGHLGQHRDVGVAAQAEDVRDAALLEVAHELLGDQFLHDGVPVR